MNGERLLKYNKKNGIVIFLLTKVWKKTGISGDGTYMSCSPTFEQFHVSFGNSGRTVPLVFGLLSGKSTFIYRKFSPHSFKKFRNSGARNEIENIITDYERGALASWKLTTQYEPLWKFHPFFESDSSDNSRSWIRYSLPRKPNSHKKFPLFMTVTFLPENRVLWMVVVISNNPLLIFTGEHFPFSTNFPRYFYRTWVIVFPMNM